MSDLIFICNECGRKHYTNEEPVKCHCGCDNFGIHENDLKVCSHCFEKVHKHNGNTRKGKFYCSCCLEYNEVEE